MSDGCYQFVLSSIIIFAKFLQDCICSSHVLGDIPGKLYRRKTLQVDGICIVKSIGYPHNLKGQGIYCYVTLIAGEEFSADLVKELTAHVRKEIGPIASPDLVQFAPGLPKTRSGKIMRRILRKIAEDEFSNLGDISTLADPAVVQDLIDNRQNRRDAAS